MPEIDGIMLARKIREISNNSKYSVDASPDIKEIHSSWKSVVIMISAAEWSDIENEARNAGVDKFLSKPLFPSAIADCINQCIGTETIISSAEPAKEFSDNFSGYHILLAEDVDINCEIVQVLLEPTSISIDYANNGAEAVKKFKESPDIYDMIFMDIQMPEMDGYQATQQIRIFEQERNLTLKNEGKIPQRAIPIIAMTANVFKEDIEKCIEAGMDDHIGKPIKFNEVLLKLRLFLKEEPKSKNNLNYS
jgi:CheY-like chemotaxis protein